MKKKVSFLLFSLASLAAVGISVAAIGAINKNRSSLFGMKATGDPFSITLNKDNVPAELTAEYQDNVSTTIQTAKGNELPVNIVLGKTAENNYVQLGGRGMIYNFGSADGIINGINGITATFTGTLLVKTSAKPLINNGVFLDEDVSMLTSGSKFTPVSPAKYFALIAYDGGATIESIKLDYSCSEIDVGLAAVNGAYTGVGSDGYTWQLDLDNGNAVIHTLDRPSSQLMLTGTYEFLSASQAKCTFDYSSHEIYYTVNMSADGKFTYVSKSDNAGGAVAAGVAEINFAKVYNVEDFESYSAAGNGYDKNHYTKASATGLRAHWHSDYYEANSSKPSMVGDKNWGLMNSSDYLQFGATKGHNGSKAAAFKGNSNGLRFIQMNPMYGIPAVIGKGSTLSFWAKGAYSDSALGTASSNDATVKVYAYYNSQITAANQGTRTEATFTIPAGSDWTEYTLALDASKNYYAVGFYNKQSSTVYTPIDDIMIYTASPYAQYVPPVAATGVEVTPATAEVDAHKKVQLTAEVAPADASNKVVAWSSDHEDIATVDANGLVTGVAAGTATITATTDDGGFTDTCVVTVNTAPVYLSGLHIGSVTVNIGSEATFPIAIATGTNEEIEFAFNGQNTGVTKYTCDGSTFSIQTKNSVSFKIKGTETTVTVVAGTLSGTIADGTFKNCSFSGTTVNSSSITPTNNGSITFVKQDSSNSLFKGCDDNTATLQATFGRRWRAKSTDSWTWDTTNTNRVEATTAYYMDGTGAMKFRGYADGESALTLHDDLPEAYRSAFNNVSFWVYNSSSSALTIKLFIFTGAGFTNASNIGDYVIQPGQWTFVSCGYNVAIYNLQLYVQKAPATALYYDNFCLYHA